VNRSIAILLRCLGVNRPAPKTRIEIEVFAAKIPTPMKYILILLGLCACVTFARAELPPALKPHADKFEADRAALTAAGEARLKPARERYLAVLAAGQKSATAAAKTGDIAAIASEIEGVNSGTLVEAFPPDLPRAFAQDRRTYIAEALSVAKTIPPRQRELATKYLQTLAAFEATALKTKDAALTEAIAAEKTRVIALMEAAGGGQKYRNVVANGDFSQGAPGSFPPEWKAEAGDVQVTDATIIGEGTEKFLRFRRLQAARRANLLPENEINIPRRSPGRGPRRSKTRTGNASPRVLRFSRRRRPCASPSAPLERRESWMWMMSR
jgi:hypothetical protein